MLVTQDNGWSFDTANMVATWGDKSGVLPDASVGALIYFGSGYLKSAAAARTVNDSFKKAWLEGARKSNPDAKLGDAPKSAVPATDSPEYRAALRKAQEALFDKLLSGYELGVREGSGDPMEEAIDRFARPWLQGLATLKHWYTLPAKKKVARDSDPYADPKGRWATFGEALAAFKASAAPAHQIQLFDENKKPFPFKVRKDETVAAALSRQAEAWLAEQSAGKGGLSGEVGDADF